MSDMAQIDQPGPKPCQASPPTADSSAADQCQQTHDPAFPADGDAPKIMLTFDELMALSVRCRERDAKRAADRKIKAALGNPDPEPPTRPRGIITSEKLY